MHDVSHKKPLAFLELDKARFEERVKNSTKLLFFGGKLLPFTRGNSWQIEARQKERCPKTAALRLGRTRGTHGAAGGKQQGAPCP